MIIGPSVVRPRCPTPINCAGADVLAQCEKAFAHLDLDEDARRRAGGYVAELLTYNERTNVYSKSAYGKLPFHIADSLTLATRIRNAQPRGILDLGSGSGLPSLLIACVNPEVPVFAVESKSRKTRFLTHAARKLGLDSYAALTQNVNELARSWCFDVDVVTAKAFKPLPDVGPIGRRCILSDAQLLIPISRAQVEEFALTDSQLEQQGEEFVYYSEAISASHGAAQRKLVSLEAVRNLRL